MLFVEDVEVVGLEELIVELDEGEPPLHSLLVGFK